MASDREWSAAADEDATALDTPAPRGVRRTRSSLRTALLRALARNSRGFPFVRLDPPRAARR